MIWLTGNKGMLGTEVETLLKESGMPFVGTDRMVDITKLDAISAFLDSLRPDRPEWIVNCAAYTAVDLAEEEPDSAFAVNADGPRNLAHAARMAGAAIVHVSTDYVFNGRKEEDYDEGDTPDPINVYGKSKLQGEAAIREALPEHYIIRTAWLYGKNGKNFVDTMLQLFRARKSVRVVCDQFGNPTYAVDLARFIMTIISRGERRYGMYNFTNEGRTSWYDFAQAIRGEAAGSGMTSPDVEILPVSTEEYPTRARRPRSSCLSKGKARRELGVSARDWRGALRSYLSAKAGGGSS
jgi:dTDP-4-dehydrorhamnose reductase